MTATAVEDVLWNLEELVDGGGAEACDRLLDEATGAREGLRRAPRGPASRSSTAPASPRRWTSSARSRSSPGAPATTRTCASRPTPRIPANGALVARVNERSTAIETQLLFFDLEWAELDDATRRRAARRRRPRPRAPSPAHGAPLPPAPPQRARGEADGREVGHRPRRLGAPLQRADERDPRRAPRRGRGACRSTRALSRLHSPDRDVRRGAAEAVTAALEPGLRTRAYIFNTLLQDKATDDRLRSYPTWISSRNLSNEASDESVQALLSVVESRLRPAAPLVPPQGAAARPRAARRLRPRGVGRAATSRRSTGTRAATIVLDAYHDFSPQLGDLVEQLLRRALDRRAGRGPASAAARSAPTPCRASTPT